MNNPREVKIESIQMTKECPQLLLSKNGPAGHDVFELLRLVKKAIDENIPIIIKYPDSVRTRLLPDGRETVIQEEEK